MIRSGFKSRVFDPTAKLTVKIKPRKCAVVGCANRFEKRSMTHRACGPECAAVLVKIDREKADRKAAKIERANTLARKEAIKTIPQLKAEAQKDFNAFVRARDRLAGHPCISSGRTLNWLLLGGGVDAGHYRSVGSADHLRFNEDNCHAQSKQDNRYGSGNAVDYRIGLIARIGLVRVEVLEADQTVVKWTRELLIGIRATYKQKLKELLAREATC